MKALQKLLTVVVSVGTLFMVVPVEGAVEIVTSPMGVFTNPGGTGAGDPVAFDTWLRRNVRNNGAVGITTDFARSGNGSAYFSGSNPIASSSKADLEYFFSDLTGKTLGNLSALSYDWYRDSSSTANAGQHPSLRLYFDADGNLGTTTDRGYLVYERAYNTPSTVPVDAWQTDNAFLGNLWMVKFGTGNQEVYDRDINDWLTTANPNPSYSTLSASTLIYGISTGIGSGWNPFEGAVDNITIGFGGSSTTYNFEVASAVPEPSTYIAGALLLLPFAVSTVRRFRRNHQA